jgi:hypothetical protein
MSTKRTLLYLALLVGLAALVWVLWPASEQENARAPRKRDRLSRAGLQSPALMGRDQEPVLLTAVQGRVLDGDTGQPIPEVKLSFSALGASASATTDAKGEYRVEIPGGTYRVGLRCGTHVAPRRGNRVQVEPGSPVQWLDFQLYRRASVAGRVVDPGSQPVASATVRVERARGPRRFDAAGIATTTDAQGRFTLRVPPGEVVLRAESVKLGTALSSPLYVQAGAHLEGVTIRVGGGLVLTGQVIGPGGQQVTGAEVLLRDELGVRRVPCDDEGGFGVTGLSPGAKLLQATAKDFSPSHVTQLKLRPGRPQKVLLQVIASKGVGGQVVDANDEPLGGIKVTVRPGNPGSRLVHLAEPAQTTTGADGRFMVTQVPLAPLVITAHGPGNLVASRSGVAPGTYDTVLRLQGTGVIVGKVSDGMSGKPVRDFTVAVTAATGTGNPYSPLPALRVVSPSGSFTVEDLVPGTYTLSFTAPGYGAEERTKVAVTAGHNTRVAVVLNAAGEIAGVVVDPRGVGIPGASVRVDTGWLGEPAVTDAAGGFTIRDVARGRRSLSTTHPGYDTRIVSGVSVFPKRTAQVRVELSPKSGKGPGLRFSGIGVVLSNRAGKLTVLQALAGSPAEVAGIVAGDVVLAINGARMSFQEAIEAIRGIIGTPVRLRLLRGERSFEVDVIRDEVALPGKS